MVTDQQYRDLLKKVNDLEGKLNNISRALTSMKMNGEAAAPKIKQPEPENRRDVTRYKFNGQKYCKRQLALAIVKKFIDENEVSDIDEIWEVFPDYVQGSLGVVRKAEDAEMYEGATERYFFEDENVILLNNGTYVVCKDWTAKNIKKLIDIAETIGYRIEPIYRD